MNIEIANRLQALRKEKGYSQEQLALELGISRQAVSKWERAESSPDTDNLICLAKLYNVSLDYLLSTDETVEEIKANNTLLEENNDSNDEVEEEKEENKIISAFNGIIPIGITLAYLIMGCCFNLWHPGWIIFLLIPILFSVIEMIKVRKLSEFLFPVFITAVYLYCGFEFKWWHPGWVLFLTIPLFYIITDAIEK